MIDVIVCAKDPAENLLICLKSLKRQNGLKNIIVVSPQKSDYVHKIVRNEMRCKLIIEPEKSCLALARKIGIIAAENKYVAFVDSDVLLGRNHLLQLKKEHTKLSKTNKYVVVEGILENYSTSPLSLTHGSIYETQVLKIGDRGFTHNTLTKRETLIDWKPHYTFAMEDLLITNHVFNKGGIWHRFKQDARSFHIEETNQFNRASWASAAERILGRRTLADVLYRIYYYSKYGIENTIIYRDIRWLIYCFSDSAGQIMGHLYWNKYKEIKK